MMSVQGAGMVLKTLSRVTSFEEMAKRLEEIGLRVVDQGWLDQDGQVLVRLGANTYEAYYRLIVARPIKESV